VTDNTNYLDNEDDVEIPDIIPGVIVILKSSDMLQPTVGLVIDAKEGWAQLHTQSETKFVKVDELYTFEQFIEAQQQHITSLAEQGISGSFAEE